MAVWSQMVEDEILGCDDADAAGDDSEALISDMLDLIKAFKKIRRKDLVAAALRWRFIVQQLRVMVSIDSMKRRVVADGSFCRMVQVYSAVVAGSS